MATFPDIKPVEIEIGGKTHSFDIDDPDLPAWVEDNAFSSGGFPYAKKLDKDEYAKDLEKLQIELVKLQYFLQASGKRIVCLYEGRDAAGKGGTIFVTRAYLNPRAARVVALSKPTEIEQGQWYYQRYVSQFPTAGEIVMFDRSWYNRAGVEPIMGFCTPEQYKKFLEETPDFEKMVITDRIVFFKFWLNIGREMQIKRFHDRRHDPLKTWKLSPMDIAALNKWDEYTEKRDRMIEATHTNWAPWTIVRANDKRRARLNAIRVILDRVAYDGKDKKAIGEIDDKILGHGPKFLK